MSRIGGAKSKRSNSASQLASRAVMAGRSTLASMNLPSTPPLVPPLPVTGKGGVVFDSERARQVEG